MIEAATIQFPESNFGSTGKNGFKISIAYATQFGTMGEMVDAIGDALSQEGNTVLPRLECHPCLG